MSEAIQFVGLDVHAAQTVAAAVELGTGVVRQQRIVGPPVSAVQWLAGLPGEVRAVYEAGPTGFGLARAARERGIQVMVCSPGAIPRQPGDRVKTDVRDAIKLARLHAAGQLRPVVVPTRELEALRDLVRCREDVRGDLMRCRHRISKMLLRRDCLWAGPGHAWTHAHLQWLSTLRFHDSLVDMVLGEQLAQHEALLARRDRLDELLVEQAVGGGQAALIARLRCLRGIDTLTAIGLVAEIGEFRHFTHPRRLASYLGMTPSEHSSGTKRRQGAITKAGSSHARRLLVEAAWHYRRPPRVSLTLRRRQDGQRADVIDAAWRAQLRLHRRWTHLDQDRGKRRTTVAVAVARELACFVWEIARLPD